MKKAMDRGLGKALSMALLFITVVSLVMTSYMNSNKIKVSAHNSYFVTVVFDDSTNRLVSLVVSEDNDVNAKKHLEADIGDFSSKTEGIDWSIPMIPTSDEEKKKSEDIYKPYIETSDGTKGLVFTFPGVHGGGWFGAGTEKVDANGEDEQLAYAYAETVIGGLNQAIDFIESDSGTTKTGEDMRAFMVDLANTVDGSGSSFSFNGVSYSIVRGETPKMKAKLLNTSDYVKIISGQTNNYVIVPYKMNKGYQGDNPFRETSVSYKDVLKEKKDPEEIGWKYAVLQANYNKDVKSVTFSSVNKITKPNQLEVIFSGMISSVLGAVRQILGLYPMEELMLNEGARSQSYYYGIMPHSWKGSANLLFSVCLIIAWLILSGAILKILINKSLSTINVTQKISMMEGFKNLIMTAFLLAFFPFLFYLLAKFNYTLVGVFANAGNFTSYFGTTDTMGSGVLGTVLISVAFFIVNVYFNVQYVLRAVTVAILYAISPLAIVSLAFGGKTKMIFSSCMKQLVGNIYTQTFHAMCIAFFTNITSTTSMKTFELLIVFYSFIPLTKFVKQQIFGLDGGIQDEAGGMVDNLKGVATGVVGGFVGGAFADKMQGSYGGGFGGGGGGFSNAKTDTLANAVKNDNGGEKFGAYNTNGALLGANNNTYSGASGVTDGKSRLIASKGPRGSVGGLAKNLAKSAGGVAVGLASSGASLGFSAIGDRRGAQQMASIAGGAMGYAGYQATKTHNDDVAMARAGINDVYENNDSLTFKYDAGEDGTFRDDNINNSPYADNIRDIYNAYAGMGDYEGNVELQELAKEHYAKQGINGVGIAGDGDIAINVDKHKFSQLRGGVNYKSVGNLQRFDYNRASQQLEYQKSQRERFNKETVS